MDKRQSTNRVAIHKRVKKMVIILVHYVNARCILRVALILAFTVLGGCCTHKPDDHNRGSDAKAKSKSNETFELYISNQAPDLRYVDIKVWIDDVVIADERFPYGDGVRASHTWIHIPLVLKKGSHRLRAVTKEGNAEFETTFELKGGSSGVLNYYPNEGTTDGRFSFTFYNTSDLMIL